MKKYLKSFWNWLKDLTTLDERTAELYGEAKSRAKEVKKEFDDVKKAAKNIVNQSKDVVEAVISVFLVSLIHFHGANLEK